MSKSTYLFSFFRYVETKKLKTQKLPSWHLFYEHHYDDNLKKFITNEEN